MIDNLKTIDFELKGKNIFRLFFGDTSLEDYYGDDWEDEPYEHNAGEVHRKFVKGVMDFAIISDLNVFEPANCSTNLISKDYLKTTKNPCIIITKEPSIDYSHVLENREKYITINFEDSYQEVRTKLKDVSFYYLDEGKD